MSFGAGGRYRTWRSSLQPLLVIVVCDEGAGFAFRSFDFTQGRLAQARLTLGYNPQLFQGWCVTAQSDEVERHCRKKAQRPGIMQPRNACLNRVPFLPELESLRFAFSSRTQLIIEGGGGFGSGWR